MISLFGMCVGRLFSIVKESEKELRVSINVGIHLVLKPSIQN